MGIGGGFAVKGRTYRRDDHKAYLKFTHYGGTRNTKNESFKLIGYPEWWPDTKKKGKKGVARFSKQNRTGRAAVGWSVDEDPSMEGEGDIGAALNSACIEERKRSIPLNGAQGRRRLGLNGRGTKIIWP